ncbi:MAG TPA: BON domain-containing protein [Candidatus Limnocylindria bacterium]|nr:BON domain-containing protein [Candidatus Limnocylindria bacterium]
MKRGWQGISLAFVLASSSLLSTGCTTEQRAGRTTGEYVDDKTLNGRVRAALSDSPDYKFTDVNVESMRGTVQLSGFVGTSAQKASAEEIAKGVRGVQSVENKITVK